MRTRAVWKRLEESPLAQDAQAMFALTTEIHPQKCPQLCAKPQCKLRKVSVEAAGQLLGQDDAEGKGLLGEGGVGKKKG